MNSQLEEWRERWESGDTKFVPELFEKLEEYEHSGRRTIYKDQFVGIRIYGFCEGYFGSRSYSDKTIIASGDNWIVGKTDYGDIELATFGRCDNMIKLINKWQEDQS